MKYPARPEVVPVFIFFGKWLLWYTLTHRPPQGSPTPPFRNRVPWRFLRAASRGLVRVKGNRPVGRGIGHAYGVTGRGAAGKPITVKPSKEVGVAPVHPCVVGLS